MRGVKPALDELVGLLRAVGFGAAIDPEQLVTDPACVWVQPREIRDRTLDGGATLVVWLYLIVANVETGQAMTLLDDALAGVLALDDLVPSDSDDVIDLSAAVLLPGNSTPLPAYRVAVDLEL
jgi:hypothetical protein